MANRDHLKNLSPTEWKLMKIIWGMGSGAARDIHRVAEERFGITKGTTKILLSRLVDKGHLRTQQIGNSYLYSPVSSMLDCLCDAADELFEYTPDEVAETVMLQLVKQGRLSGEGIRTLRTLLDEYKD